MPEGIKTGLDAVAASAALSWNFLASLADAAFDLLSGRQLPEPDLKSVAGAPEPGAVSKTRTKAKIKIRRGKPIPRPSRSVQSDEAA